MHRAPPGDAGRPADAELANRAKATLALASLLLIVTGCSDPATDADPATSGAPATGTLQQSLASTTAACGTVAVDAGAASAVSDVQAACTASCDARGGSWSGQSSTTAAQTLSCQCSFACGGTAGALPGQFAVDPLGAATYDVAITVPPGIHDVAPTLALRYRSGAGNGIAGVGWQLSGLSAIARCPMTLAQDGVRGAVRFDGSDRFCLDGQRLIAISGSYGAAGTVYHTEVESWRKITSQGNCGGGPCAFVVQNKDGSVAEYGVTSDARVLAGGKSAVRVWAIDRVTSSDGNYLTTSYLQDAGQHYPLQIEYTRNAAAAAVQLRRVGFVYETRPDVENAYARGSQITQRQRLARVQTFVAANLVREYRLRYQSSAASHRSLLAGVQECGSLECLPETVFSWAQPAVSDFRIVTPAGDAYQGLLKQDDGASILTGDFNGDGKADFIRQEHGKWDDDASGTFQVYFSRGDGTFDIVTPPGDAYQVMLKQDDGATIIPADINGDGKTDFLRQEHDGWAKKDNDTTFQVYLSRGDGTFDIVTPAGDAYQGMLKGTGGASIIPGDFNGDGKTDFLRQELGDWDDDTTNTFQVYLSRGDGTFDIVTPSAIDSGSGQDMYQDWLRFDPGASITTGDFDGDGKTDFLRQEKGKRDNDGDNTFNVYFSRGDGTFDIVTPPGSQYQDLLRHEPGALIIPGDFNGDGVTDFLRQEHGDRGKDSTNTFNVYFSRGDGTFDIVTPPDDAYQVMLKQDDGATITPGDFNGDGKTDFVRREHDGWDNDDTSTFQLYLSRGDGTFDIVTPAGDAYQHRMRSDDGATIIPADYNGDGKLDLIRQDHDGWDDDNTDNFSVLLSKDSEAVVDRVTTIQNGLGGAVTVSYQSLTNPSVYTAPSAAAPPGQVAGKGPYYVVSATTERDGAATADHAFTYAYKSAVIDLNGRGFLGFSEIATTEVASGVVTRTRFSQSFPHLGRPLQVEVSAPAARVLRTSYTLAAPSPFPGVFQSLVTAQTAVRQDGSASTTTITERSYDSAGNLRALRERGLSGNDSDDRATCVVYANDTSAWRLGFPQDITIADACDDSCSCTGVRHREHRTYSSDGKMSLVSTAAWDDSGARWLTTGFQYDSFGQLTQSTAPDGAVNRTTYDTRYQTFPIKTELVEGTAVRLTQSSLFDPGSGQLRRASDSNGDTLVVMLDTLGRAVAVSRPAPSGSLEEVARFTWGRDGDGPYREARQRVDWGQETWSSERHYVDGAARTVAIRRSGPDASHEIRSDYRYDHAGRVLSEIGPYFAGASSPAHVEYRYDALGHLVSATDQVGTTLALSYALGGCAGCALTVTTTQAAGTSAARAWTMSQDAFGHVVRRRDPENVEVTQTFDRVGRLTAVNDATGRQQIAYDSLDRPTTTASVDRGQYAYTYDAMGRTALVVDPKGQRTTFRYDGLGRVTSEITGGDERRYEYDAGTRTAGRLSATATVSGGAVVARWTYAYTPSGQRASETLTRGVRSYTLSYGYDPQDRLRSMTFPDGSTMTVALDPAGDPTAIALGGTSYAQIGGYDAAGQPGQMTLGNGTVTNYGYDAARRLTDLRVTKASGGAALLNNHYTWSALSQIQKIDDLVEPSRSRSYGYSAAGALASATGAFGSKSYSHDAAGNLTSKDGVTYTFDRHRVMTGSDGFTASYDINGNRVSQSRGGRTWSFTYDGRDQLTQVAIGGTVQGQFTYDVTGQRLSKTDPDGTLTLYVGPSFEVTVLPDGREWQTRYVTGPAGRIAAITTGPAGSAGAGIPQPGTAYYHPDHLGSTSLVTDASAGVIQRLEYLPFGGIYTPRTTGSDVTRHKFAGMEWDRLPELNYVGARYQDPVTGNFLTADNPLYGGTPALTASLNPYAYGINDPVSYIDPSGHFVVPIIGGLIGAYMGGVAAYGTWNPLRWDWGSSRTYEAMGIGAGAGLLGGFAFGGVAAGVGGGLIGAILGGAAAGAIEAAGFEGARFLSDDGSSWKEFGIGVATGAAIGGPTGGLFYGAGAALARRGVASAAPRLDEFRAPPSERPRTPCAMSCFVAGTQIATDDGERPIEDIREGDQVYAYDDATATTTLHRVVRLFQRPAGALVRIAAAGEIIEATPEHPFWVDALGWTEAGDIGPGDPLVNRRGERVIVDRVEVEFGEFTVYNFEVEQAHSYFVSAQETLVHNTCGDLTESRWNRPGWRKAKVDDVWNSTPSGPGGGKICQGPGCGTEFTRKSGPRDWDMDHIGATWDQRKQYMAGREVSTGREYSRAEIRNTYHDNIDLKCKNCNRSHRWEPTAAAGSSWSRSSIADP